MKKKLITLVTALICVLICAFSLAACGSDAPKYYNRAYTLTGKATINWDDKIRADSYGNAKGDFSQKQIVTKYWDKIDWSKTKSITGDPVDVKHSDVNEFINEFKSFEENIYADYKDAKIAVTQTDNKLELTLNLPEGARRELPSTIKMPFAETQEQFDAIKPTDIPSEIMNLYALHFKAGYAGIGVYKIQDGSYLTVSFGVEQYTSNINVEITQISSENRDTLFANSNNGTILTLYDSNNNEILDIRHEIGYTAENI